MDKVVDVGKPDVALIQLVKIKPFLRDNGPKGGQANLKFRMGSIYTSVTKILICGVSERPIYIRRDIRSQNLRLQTAFIVI
jgi:hypothetical protein